MASQNREARRNRGRLQEQEAESAEQCLVAEGRNKQNLPRELFG